MFSYCRHPKKKKGAKERVLFLSVSTTDDDDDDDTDDDYYAARSCPSSYDQSSGNGQSLSRRYCTQSVWLFLCASRTARESQGALAVSCKYFKQSQVAVLGRILTRISSN